MDAMSLLTSAGVVLEFISGGSLQLACEDSVAQGQMLKSKSLTGSGRRPQQSSVGRMKDADSSQGLIDTHRAWLKYEASQD